MSLFSTVQVAFHPKKVNSHPGLCLSFLLANERLRLLLRALRLLPALRGRATSALHLKGWQWINFKKKSLEYNSWQERG